MQIKKVMLIWGTAGGGHRSGMQAIHDALKEIDPSVEIIDIDAYSRPWSFFPLTLVPRAYDVIVAWIPWAWQILFRLSNSQRGLRATELMTGWLFSPVFEKPLRDFQPDVVVCVIHSISGGLKRALKIVGQNPPIGMVVQDIVSLHQVWLVPEAAWFAMPTQEACQVALDNDFPSDKLRLVGMPLRKMFWAPAPDRATLRRQLGLPEDGLVTLIIGGPGLHRLEAIVDSLLEADLPGHIAVVAVSDDQARQRLMLKVSGRSFSVAGRVDNMSDWMWASDLLIAKAGPNVIYEAMRCRLPMILADAIPGQETGNLGFAEQNGVGVVATQPARIADTARRILIEPGVADGMKSAMQKICHVDAAREIARIILTE
ncbi:MAG: glycosyltransferase [Anaerolineae bacterium]|nr:glycosyltransferase [Anaerolineae bacterium]